MSSRERNARERVQSYQQEKRGESHPAPDGAGQGPHRTPEQWTDFINQRIEEAMRAGAFSNLPGKGKPINTAPEPYVRADMQMANSLLKNNDLVPGWIADRKAVLDKIERFRTRLRAAAAVFRQSREQGTSTGLETGLTPQQQAQVNAWRSEIQSLNRQIEDLNYKQPAVFLEIFKLRLEDELKSAGISLGD
ncbi:MAG: DUF1992 domain-containing protein [Caldilineaceae bacterium]|nr:DUF1992 domain-containing protein [Caldilineaceae bacterium]